MTALGDARQWLSSKYGPQYAAWLALGDVAASQTLVSATQLLNELPWLGTSTGILNGQPTSLSWPRSGVVVDGVPIDPLTIPPEITEATFELAVLIYANPKLPNQADQGSNMKSASAGGGVSIEFFAPTSARFGTATVLPVIIQRLVGKFLAGSTGAADGGSAGIGSPCSQFGEAHQLRLGRPE